MGDEEIEFAVAVVIHESTARGPADIVMPEASLAGDIGEGAVAVVVQKNVMSPKGDEQVDESVVVVIAGADSLPPAHKADACFLRDVRKRAIAIVAVEVAGGFLTLGKTLQATAVDQKN